MQRFTSLEDDLSNNALTHACHSYGEMRRQVHGLASVVAGPTMADAIQHRFIERHRGTKHKLEVQPAFKRPTLVKRSRHHTAPPAAPKPIDTVPPAVAPPQLLPAPPPASEYEWQHVPASACARLAGGY